MSSATTATPVIDSPQNKRRTSKPKASSWRQSASGYLYPTIFVLIAFVAWWGATSAGLVAPYILPSPADTLAAFTDNVAYLWQHTLVTTWETVLGFLISVVVGIAVAIVMVYSRTLERTFYPLILFAQVIPKIAIAPLFIVWLGFGPQPKILVAVLMAFFPIVIAGISGLRTIDPEILELTSTMGASRWKTFMKVRFPAALPELLSGMKIAATLAVTGAVVGEFVGANEGLGYVILQANGNVDTAMLFAALIIMSLLGILLFAVILVAERILVPWHSSRRNLEQ
ncbi:ABC transporter permease [Gulosibacter chungangensis]|uniref:ABC transporter permease n=1 Tax=Gulosibacter chungangensis TaxID=979746 RepID=A0A7J5B9M8_9MICO|nr:ABC transporter permease [Gulosibacter chungangensis]KAB1642242.1 ABC transporter permease [Gulosibacter chungangensis]